MYVEFYTVLIVCCLIIVMIQSGVQQSVLVTLQQGDCGRDTTHSNGEDMVWVPEPVVWMLDDQLDAWPGFSKVGMLWLVYRDDWDMTKMLAKVQESDVPLIGSRLMVILVVVVQCSKNQVCVWVREMIQAVERTEGSRLACTMVIPLEEDR